MEMEGFSLLLKIVLISALCILPTITATTTMPTSPSTRTVSTSPSTTTAATSTSPTPSSPTTSSTIATTTSTQRVITTTTSAAASTTITAPSPTIFDPFTKIATLRESSAGVTPLAEVACHTTNLTCICNKKRVIPLQGDSLFDVWSASDGKFRVYFVGTPTASSGLHYSRTRSYKVEVICTDNTGKPATPDIRTLEVDILPNHPPTVTGYPKDVSIDASMIGKGADIHKVDAKDPERDLITFSMAQSPDKEYFTIGPYDGIIKSAVDLKTATVDTIVCTVTVTDGHDARKSVTVTVKLSNLNARPVISNLPATVNVTELQTQPGFTLITLTFSDPDNTGAVKLEPECSVDPSSESFKFHYETNTRRLTLSSTIPSETLLDYEKTKHYLITCSVFDGYLYSEGDVLTVNVLNVNEPPVFDASTYFCTMYESKAGVSSCDLGLKVTDPEQNSITTVELLPGNNSERFRYNRASNKLTFNVDYDVDNSNMPTNVIVTIYAVDRYRATGSAQIQINIRDVNDNTCTFGTGQAVQSFIVDQGTNPKVLGAFQATDADLTSPNNRVTYELVSALPTSSLNYLTVFGNGEIKYIGLIPQMEHGKSFSIVVRCKDGGTPSLSATGTVLVSYLTTTTTTTTTSTTTTTTTTPTTSTTTQPPDEDIWDDGAFVALFSVLMVLLGAGLIFGVLYLLNKCYPGFLNCSFQGRASRKVKPFQDYEGDFFRSSGRGIRTSPLYKEHAWRSGDNYESGLGYQGVRPISNGDMLLTGLYGTRALPAPEPWRP